jgi:hypothetical protein
MAKYIIGSLGTDGVNIIDTTMDDTDPNSCIYTPKTKDVTELEAIKQKIGDEEYKNIARVWNV